MTPDNSSNPYDNSEQANRRDIGIAVIDAPLRAEKIPCPVEPRDGERVYIWLCPEPSCRRACRLPYRRNSPLPCCMGGPKLHPKQLLVCEVFDIYQECFYRFGGLHERLGRPVIYPRNYFQFPKLRQGEWRRDFSTTEERDR